MGILSSRIKLNHKIKDQEEQIERLNDEKISDIVLNAERRLRKKWKKMNVQKTTYSKSKMMEKIV